MLTDTPLLIMRPIASASFYHSPLQIPRFGDDVVTSSNSAIPSTDGGKQAGLKNPNLFERITSSVLARKRLREPVEVDPNYHKFASIDD